MTDWSTEEGASALCQRLTQYWLAQGQSREFEPHLVTAFGDNGHKATYGVREIKRAPKVAVVEWFHVGPTPRQRIKAAISDMLERHFPEVPYAVVMNKWRLDERRNVTTREQAARGRAMGLAAEIINKCRGVTEAASAHDKCSNPNLGAIFNLDHTTVMHTRNAEWRIERKIAGRNRDRARAAA